MPYARAPWRLDPDVRFLNHGSYGACPGPVLDAQQRLREEMEANPVRFFNERLEPKLERAREEVAKFLDCATDDFAFVSNATAGVSTVLRSLRLEPGDELVTTDHVYPACRAALEFVARQSGAALQVASVPFPLEGPEVVVERVLAAVGPRTKLALLDHVTSPTGLVFPIETLIRRLEERGVDVLVDGAHAPGMLPLSLRALRPAYYTGNFHKWVCAPKGAAFLFVRADRQDRVHPLAVSYGQPRSGSKFRTAFEWTGTQDFSPFLCMPEALACVGGLVPGGWPEVMRSNREKVLRARRVLAAALGVPLPCPDEMIGSLAALPLSPGPREASGSYFGRDALMTALSHEHRTEAPVFAWPAPPGRLLRVSAQLYNEPREYEELAEVLQVLLPREGRGQSPSGTVPRSARFATIDIGTNSVLLLVAERLASGAFHPVEELAEITRLGRGVDRARRLSPEGMEETLRAVEAFAARARALGAQGVIASATSAARDAENGAEFLALVRQRAGVDVEVISGDREAHLAFTAAQADFGKTERLVVIDIGGGSTEVIVGAAPGATGFQFRESFDVGSVRLTERLVRSDPPTPEELASIRGALAQTFAELEPPQGPFRLVGIAGTVTTLYALVHAIDPYDAGRVHGGVLSLDDVRSVAARLAGLTLEQRKQLKGLQPKRADVICAGAHILLAAMERLSAAACTVSDRGVRWGLMLDRFASA